MGRDGDTSSRTKKLNNNHPAGGWHFLAHQRQQQRYKGDLKLIRAKCYLGGLGNKRWGVLCFDETSGI